MIWLPLAAMFVWIEMIFFGERFNKSNYCGFGVTPYVWIRKAQAPMSDRVLMAWLNKFSGVLYTKLTGKPFIWLAWAQRWMYLFWKWVFVASSLALCNHMFGFGAAAFLAFVWVMCWMFDYWCIYVEALCFLLALTGNLPLALLAVVLGPLSRESTMLVVPIYAMVTGDYLGGLGLAVIFATVYYLKRRWVGPRERYVHTFCLWNNVLWRWWFRHWKQRGDAKQAYFLFGVFWIVLSLAALLLPMPGVLAQTAWAVPVLLLVSGLLLGYIWEPRTMINTAIWIGPALIGAYG